MPLQATKVYGHRRVEIDPNSIVAATIGRSGAAVLDRRYVRCLGDDGFRKQESDREVCVVTWRSHRDRYTGRGTTSGCRIPQPNLKRFLNCDPVIERLCGVATYFTDFEREAAGDHFDIEPKVRPSSISQGHGRHNPLCQRSGNSVRISPVLC